jgi:hypothetical protein
MEGLENTGQAVQPANQQALGTQQTQPTLETQQAQQAHQAQQQATLVPTFQPQNLKINLPDEFHGSRQQLRTFLMQSELYIGFNANKFGNDTDKVLWMVSFLRGPAFAWVEPFLEDFMNNKTGGGRVSTAMKDTTKILFRTVKGFKEGISKVYGDIDPDRTAERALQALQQQGSATKYTAEFQQHMHRTHWDDHALRAQYYKGLKDSVKDEMARSDKPDDLAEMIELAIKIDDRMYERKLEKKGQYHNTQHKKPNSQPQQKAYWPQPMELDATRWKREPSKEERDRRRKNKLCYECGLPGHQAAAHRKKQAQQQGRTPWRKPKWDTSRKQLNATRTPLSKQVVANKEVPNRQLCATRTSMENMEENWPTHEEEQQHEQLSWTACYNDQCRIHRSDKEGSNYWPQTPKKNKKTHIHQYPDGPKQTPQVDDKWDVVQNNIWGVRQWACQKTGSTYNEYNAKIEEKPFEGETYEVRYRDNNRIVWSNIETKQIYTEKSLTHPEEDIPQRDEIWEVLFDNKDTRIWRKVGQEYTTYFQPEKGTHNLEGQIFQVKGLTNNGIIREWENVITRKKYYEQTPAYEQKIEARTTAAEEEAGQLFAVRPDGQIHQWVYINGHRLRAMIDSGATGNFIAEEAVQKAGIRLQTKAYPYQLQLVDGTTAGEDDGMIRKETKPERMRIDGHEELIQLDVVPLGHHLIILGMPWLRKHNPRIDWYEKEMFLDQCDCGPKTTFESARLYTHGEELNANETTDVGYQAQDPSLKQIPGEYKEFSKIFEEKPQDEALPEHNPWDHEMKLEEGKEPPFSPIYSMSADDLGTLKEYIEKNLRKGYIRESTSPAGSPVLFVPKKDGTRRLCVDYRKLNAITIKDRYPLPLATELRDRLSGARIFTKLDLRDGYHLIRIKEGEEWKTAFRTRYGHYEYQVMPFGLTNAPATFMRLMNNVLSPYLDVICICYLDDVLIYSKNKQEHIQDVKKVLTVLRNAKLLLKPSKCEFHVNETEFLGYIVTPEGLKMSPEKIKAVLEWKAPTNVKEVQSFLGFANFYRRFIKNYSAIASPLTELTKKDQTYNWTELAQTAFDFLKKAFTTAPILRTFDPEKEIIVETDASDFAIGAVLSQPGETKK